MFDAEALRMKRLEKRISSTDLGGICGVTRATIHSWENGVTVPDANRLKCLSETLDVPVEFFFDDGCYHCGNRQGEAA